MNTPTPTKNFRINDIDLDQTPERVTKLVRLIKQRLRPPITDQEVILPNFLAELVVLKRENSL